MDKNNNKYSLRNEKLKENRASETEGKAEDTTQKGRARRRTKIDKRKRKGRQKHKTTRKSALPFSKD